MSADQLNIGVRKSDMPGARDVSTVTAMLTDAALSPSATSPSAKRYRSTMLELPPPGPPLAPKAASVMIRPLAHAQKPNAARRGYDNEREPNCNGTTAMASPIKSGATMA